MARVRPEEEPRPNGTACVKKCLDEGSPAVFISEQAKAVYEVRDYPAAKDDVGFRVEITGDVDEKAGTVAVKSVKRLSEVTAMCLVPKKAPVVGDARSILNDARGRDCGDGPSRRATGHHLRDNVSLRCHSQRHRLSTPKTYA